MHPSVFHRMIAKDGPFFMVAAGQTLRQSSSCLCNRRHVATDEQRFGFIAKLKGLLQNGSAQEYSTPKLCNFKTDASGYDWSWHRIDIVTRSVSEGELPA